jgi:hypothetical protein
MTLVRVEFKELLLKAICLQIVGEIGEKLWTKTQKNL